jgi:hypothetical protein
LAVTKGDAEDKRHGHRDGVQRKRCMFLRRNTRTRSTKATASSGGSPWPSW